MNEKVSVIIPVYNVEKFLKRCVDSIINQSYDNLEILLIDDGSIDNSGVICDDYSKKDKRIIVIHKKNEGLGLTRNVGIEYSTGKYLMFVDSDDYIEKNTVKDSIKTIIKDDSDIVMYGLKRIRNNGKINDLVPNPEKKIYIGKEIVDNMLPDYINDDPFKNIKRNFTGSSCTCLYKKSIIVDNDIKYESERNIISEDTYMMFNLLKHVNKVSIINKCYYNYCDNFSSLSHSYRGDRFAKLKTYYDKCNTLFKKNNYNSEVYLRFNYLFLNFVFANFKTIINCENLKMIDKYKEFQNIILDELYVSIIDSIIMNKEPLKRRIFYYLVKRKCIILCMLIIRIKY